jgi:uncharacterized membrane protein HdeD (DUF308 family)
MNTPAFLTSDVAAMSSQELMDIHSQWKVLMLEGAFVLALGLLTVAAPRISTLGIEQLVGWLGIAGGFIGIAAIIRKHQLPATWRPLSIGVLAMVLGVLLVRSPMQGVITLTVVMMVLFVINDGVTIFHTLRSRPNPRKWISSLLGGSVTLLFVYLIWQGWPNTGAWVLGLYVGLNLIYVGASLIFTVIAARGVNSAVT